jgi:hypothetical protein
MTSRRQLTGGGLAIAAIAGVLALGCGNVALERPQDGGPAGGGGAGGSGGSTAGAGGDGGSSAGGCPATITFADGATHGLAVGPHNHAFLDPMVDTSPTKNYSMQTVFAGPTLSIPADFAIAQSTITPSPASGTLLDPWLAELALLPAGCQPGSLVGKKVTVKMIWLLDGAIGNVPGHGLYLGTYSNGAPVAYADAEVTTMRTLNTLAPITLTHTFTSTTDGAEGIFFRAYLLGGDGETPTTIHVESISWQ